MTYQFFNEADLKTAETHLPEAIKLNGGKIESTGGLIVDGKLNGVTIESTDGSFISVSALAVLKDCVIKGRDVLIEGQFSGTLTATGKAEFASGCQAVGVFNKGGDVFIHGLADLDDWRVVKLASNTTKEAISAWSAPQQISVAG